MSNNELAGDNKFYMTLKAAMNLPGVKINRTEFLRLELSKYFSEDTVLKAINESPALAGITPEEIKPIADQCISTETNRVSMISAAAGVPGGLAILGTIPADTAQYFGHIIRVLQKLIYLYGWPELYNSDDGLDDETLNQMTLFIGVMFGVNAANGAISKIAQTAAANAEKKIADKALTKGMLYPIIKKIAEILGIKITKEAFAKGVSKIIPVLGGALSGGLTYVTFRSSAVNLEKHLCRLETAKVKENRDVHNCDSETPDDYVDIDFE